MGICTPYRYKFPLSARDPLGENRDYEFALHFNHSQTNFHMHLLFSERERQTEQKPKIYKRDMWFDKTTNQKANPLCI